MAQDPGRLPPLTPPPPRHTLTESSFADARRATSDYPRSISGYPPPDSVSEPIESGSMKIGGFAPEKVIDEQIEDLEGWARANLARDRREKLRFWILRGCAFLGAACAAVAAAYALTKVAIGLSAMTALCVAIDAAWPIGAFRNIHQRAVFDLRELQNTLKLRWDKVRLAHPDPAAPQRIAHALALLDAVQTKRDEIGKYLGNSEPSPGVNRKG